MGVEISNTKQKLPRVLHGAALLSPSSGMLLQMQWEQDAAEQIGIDWHVKMYCPQNIENCYKILCKDRRLKTEKHVHFLEKIISWIRLRYNYNRWLLQQQNHIDIFLLRYYVHDPFQLWFVKRCKKPVFFVHHTLEVPELAQAGGVLGFLRSMLERVLGRLTIKNVKGIIGVTKEIADYEVARSGGIIRYKLVYPNGILIDQKDLIDRRKMDVPEFVFVANFSPWHGLDIVLREVAKSNQQFILHLVGKVPHDLFSLIDDPRVRVHGVLSQEQISQLSEQCWVGLASFALFRNNMKQACPLKVREYLMLGLPVCGDFEDIFPSDVNFYKKGSGNIDELINFSFSVRGLGKGEVREAAKKWIDKKSILSKLYHDLTVCFGRKK